ncbi:MAG TPA: hypothetical protein VFF96_06625 [Pseudoxanthomonas sp.]|nr:hypothetical protein [Pseudoxanthomonas sp.]
MKSVAATESISAGLAAAARLRGFRFAVFFAAPVVFVGFAVARLLVAMGGFPCCWPARRRPFPVLAA